MAAVKQTANSNETDADSAWGYKFGCDGIRSVVDTAEFLGVSRQTVYRYINDGKLRSGKHGKICLRSITNYAHSLEK